MFRTFWHALSRHRDWERDLDEELKEHVRRRVEVLVRAGLTPAEARRRARLEFGSPETYKEQCREAHGLRWLDEIRQDVLYATRILLRYPGFSVVAILSLALGIGANTVVFSVTSALLLRPLPVESPEQLYSLNRNGGPSESFPNYRDIRDRNRVFPSLFSYRIAPMSLGTIDGARRVWGFLVTGNYFETLGIRPALGRVFGPQEDLHPNASPYAVLSYTCWQNRFGSDRGIVGRTVQINTHPYTVLGVLPRGFQGTEVFYWPEIWVPMMMQPQIEGRSWLELRGTRNAWVAGRLKPDVSPRQAEADLKIIADELAREHRMNEGMRLTLSAPGLAGSMLRGPVARFAGGVMLLASLVLLAACANLASLLSARLTDRTRELSIRLSIGAGRGRLLRQLLTESLVLSFLGGLAGLGLAVLLLRLLSQWRAPLEFPVQLDVNPDLRVFAFAFAAALATGVLFGIGPALRAWRSDPTEGLKGSSTSSPGRRWAFRDLLLAAQVAACCLLVSASFVAVSGLVRSLKISLGFQPAGAATVGYDLSLSGYSQERGRSFHQRAWEALSRIPGVAASAFASSVPLSINQSNTGVYQEQTTDFRPMNRIRAIYYQVSPGYFQTMGTKLIAGREFTLRDADVSRYVAIVNQTFAQRVLGPGEWIGKRFRQGGDLAEVIGVVEDGKYESLTEEPKPVLFQPILAFYSPDVVLIARSSRAEADVAADMRRVLASMDSSLPVYGVGSLTQMLGFVYFPVRAAAIALSAFGLLAIMLAATGVYGLAAYTVAQRVREIGIRIAIGARPANVLCLVFARTAVLVAFGSLIGLALGALGAKVLAGVVVGVSPRDPLVVGGTALTMVFIGIAAACGPLRRALSVDPAQALRQE